MKQGLCAQMNHYGHGDQLDETYDKLALWISANGYKMNGDGRHIPMHHCSNDFSRWETIVRIPVVNWFN
jgi:effector-binding domain-containing protein